MILNYEEYRDKLMGCWAGKNIGGVLGMPFEGVRGVFDVDYYQQDLSKDPPPNDDLDIQMIYLLALERYGKNVNSEILGEYWLKYQMADWQVFGSCKAHMRMGLAPPLSGYVNNSDRDNIDPFILAEIWACIAPGHPQIAVEYAKKDAVVLCNNGTDGYYGEIFLAAVESAAFAIEDKFKLIDIGLSYIPEDCGMSKAIRAVLECYHEGATWQDARQMMFTLMDNNPSIADDAPTFIKEKRWVGPMYAGFVIIGWLYGEDDFGKSLCITVNCGEDTDTTAASLGAILGIINGYKNIPEKWIKPIGDDIGTMCINLTDWQFRVPKSVPEFADRIIKLAPVILGSDICNYINDFKINMSEESKLYCPPALKYFYECGENYTNIVGRSTLPVMYEFLLFSAELYYLDGPFVFANKPCRFRLILKNNTNTQEWLSLNFHTPDGFTVTPSESVNAYLDIECFGVMAGERTGRTIIDFEVTAESLEKGRSDILVDITVNGHFSRGTIPIVLLQGGYSVLYKNAI